MHDVADVPLLRPPDPYQAQAVAFLLSLLSPTGPDQALSRTEDIAAASSKLARCFGHTVSPAPALRLPGYFFFSARPAQLSDRRRLAALCTCFIRSPPFLLQPFLLILPSSRPAGHFVPFCEHGFSDRRSGHFRRCLRGGCPRPFSDL